jgi:hypothetical protein
MRPHSSLVLVHLRHPMKSDPTTLSRSPMTLDDIRFDPKYSQVTSTVELLLFKFSGEKLEASSSFLESINQPLLPDEIRIDVLWLHFKLNRAKR